jgi:carbamoylphosphate synthase small subunit
MKQNQWREAVTDELLPDSLLALADGTTFEGYCFGAPLTATGEVVFNTSMTVYQEIITDPSYHGQLVTMTVPHIGNVGINSEDVEASRPWAARLIVREISRAGCWVTIVPANTPASKILALKPDGLFLSICSAFSTTRPSRLPELFHRLYNYDGNSRQ